MKKVCKNCNTSLIKGNKFCTKCGSKIEVETTPEKEKNNSTKRIKINQKNYYLLITIFIGIVIVIFFLFDNNIDSIVEKKIPKSNQYQEEKRIVSTSPNTKKNITNNNSEKKKDNWKYKDWEIENIDSRYIKAFTLGDSRGDIFGIIKDKQSCNTDFLYVTTHFFKKLIKVREKDSLEFDISVDNEKFNIKAPIYVINDLGFVRQVTITPQSLSQYFINKLKKGYNLNTSILSPVRIKNMVENNLEKYSLNGFTKAYNILNEACTDISALKKKENIISEIGSSNITKIEIPNNVKKRIEYYTNNSLDNINSGQVSNYYADLVNYYNLGLISKTEVIKDKQNYVKKWPYIKYSIKRFNDSFLDYNNNYVVNTTLDFWVYNKKKQKGIKGEVVLELIFDKNTLKIHSEKSKVNYREKYFQ